MAIQGMAVLLAASLLAGAMPSAGLSAAVTPVEKVVELLRGLKSEVEDEGKTEASAYDTFACFCKEKSSSKSASISSGKDSIDSLSADMEEKTAQKAQKQTSLSEHKKQRESLTTQLAEEKARCAQEEAVYRAQDADFVKAISSLTGAIRTMKESKAAPSEAPVPTAGLLGVRQTVQKSLAVAEALKIVNSGPHWRSVNEFLQQSSGVDPDDPAYKYHSNGIIEILTKLEGEFKTKKKEADEEYGRTKKACEETIKGLVDDLRINAGAIEKLKSDIAGLKQALATTRGSLLEAEDTMKEDQLYLKDLTKSCEDRAKQWDQRSQLRADELTALSQALGILVQNVTVADSDVNQRALLLLAEKRDRVLATSGSPAAVLKEVRPLSFLQEGRARASSRSNGLRLVGRHAESRVEGRRQHALASLRQAGANLRSGAISALAVRAAADPFAKVKTLIQELIERLLQEQGNEANQKAWCDKSTSAAEQKRTYAAEEIENLNAEMASLEAIRDKLAEELTVLGEEIKELKINRAKAEQLRAEEKAENENTILEAQQGKDALESAIKLLSRFYKTVAKESVDLSLAQKKGPADDAPDAGFKIGEAYKGGQSESGGILGMMDVMKSDFSRTISETEEAEAQAEQDHLVFMTETGKSLAQKEQSESERITQKDDAEDKLSQADESLQSQTVILQTSITELLELKPVCVDTGMSYEERVERRRDEIEALKKALCVLGNYATYGPEGAADSC